MAVSIGFEIAKIIGKWLWNAYKTKKKEKRDLDFFITLISVSDLPPKEFVENTLDKFMPFAIRKVKSIEKIRRRIAKFSIIIPNVIEGSIYKEFFPDLREIKKELIQKLRDYSKLDFEELQEKFSQEIEEIGESIKVNEEVSLKDVDRKYELMIEQEPNKIVVAGFAEKIATPQDFKAVVNESVASFIRVSGYDLELGNIDHNYILHEVTGMVGEYYLEKVPTWTLKTQGLKNHIPPAY